MAMLFRPRAVPKKYTKVHEKIRTRGVRLDVLCNVYRGIWTGVLHIFVVTNEIVEEYDLEWDALKPILRGKDIGPFRYKWNERWVIYTNQDNFYERFPNVIRYLEKYKMILERRGAVWVYRRQWWELEDPLSPEMFEIEKIMSPYISRFNAFTYEEGKYYAMDSTSIIRFWFNENETRDYITKWREVNEQNLDANEFINLSLELLKDMGKDTNSLLYILGILNSEVVEFYYKLYAQRVTKRGTRQPVRKYYLYVPPHLNVIPIAVGTMEERADIVRRVNAIRNIALKLDYTEGNEKEKVEEEITFMVADLNEAVYDLYELDESERAMIQSYVLRKR